MIYGKKEKEIFEKATKYHICEGGLKRANKIDHLGKIHQWLRNMRLPNRYPSESDVKEKLYSSEMNIPEKKFQEAKAKLSEYLRKNKEVVVTLSLDREVQRSSSTAM